MSVTRVGAEVARQLEEARKVDGEIRELSRKQNEVMVEIAYRLALMESRGLATALGFESVAAYGERVLDYSASMTRALVAIGRRLPEVPRIKAAAEAGEIPWTKLRHVVAIVTSETESVWLERARTMTNRELEKAVAFEQGREVLERLVLELSPQDLADVEAGVSAIRDESPAISLGAAVAELCRRAVTGGRAGGARYRIVVTTCSECDDASRESRSGSISFEKHEVDRVACDSEILDVRNGPSAIRRSIPTKVANFVDARDRGRCRVPGCKNRTFTERHHEGGWRSVGHDPERVLTLCTSHHVARHEEKLVISFVENEPCFALSDGTPIADARSSREAPSNDSAVTS